MVLPPLRTCGGYEGRRCHQQTTRWKGDGRRWAAVAGTGSTEVTVAYLVPVQVTVDTATGEVRRVVVRASELVEDRNGFLAVDGGRAGAREPVVVGAYRVAEAARPVWPVWEIEN